MRVLVLNHNLAGRGAWFRARAIARCLHQDGHDITFVYTGEGYYRRRGLRRGTRWTEWGSPAWDPLRGHGEGYGPLGLLDRLGLGDDPYDLVYTFSHKPVDAWIARWVRRRRHAFWIADWCDLWQSQRGGLLDRRHWSRPFPPHASGWRAPLHEWLSRHEDAHELSAARRADAVSIIARPMRSWARRLGRQEDDVLFLPTPAESAAPPICRQEAREPLRLAHDTPVAAYVANVTPDNRLLGMALERVWARRPDLVFLSMGPPWFRDLAAMAPHERAGRLRDLGRVDPADLPNVLAAADFAVSPLRDLPFNRCRWPHKMLDYFSAGLPVAANDVGEVGRYLRERQAGVLGPPTPAGLASAMLRLVEDDEVRKETAQAAQHARNRDFSPARIRQRLRAFLGSRGLPPVN